MAKSNDRIPDTGYWQRRVKDRLAELEEYYNVNFMR